MSHFVCLVLAPKGIEDVESFVSKMLEPFDENSEFPPYFEPCCCKGKDKECLECNGTGRYENTYNPRSKWDWWAIGGRWSGALRAAIEGDESYTHSVDYPASLQKLPQDGNSALVSEIIDEKENVKFDAFAVVTPDGNWYAKGKMGWWAYVTEEEENWKEIYKSILLANKDCLAVCCDLHI